MMAFLKLSFILMITCLIHVGCAADIQANNTGNLTDPYNSTSVRLINFLLSKYKKRTRPVLHPSDPVIVKIKAFPYQIINVDQKRNLISISAHFEMWWDDAYLRWNPAEYDNAEYVLLPASEIWTPEIFVYYCSDDKSLIKSTMNVHIRHNGTVHNFVPFKSDTICTINVKHFPFDTQHCTIYFDTWPPNGKSVKLILVNNGTILINESSTDDVAPDYYDSQEWMLRNLTLCHEDHSVHDRMNVIAMHLHIRRQEFYYIFNLVIPSALISIVSVIGFHLPSASTGGRFSKSRLGMMTLLSMSVLLLSVVNELPKFSISATPGKKGSFSGVPLIGVYYFTLISIISLATITSSWLVVLEKQVIREGVPCYLEWLRYEEWSCWRDRFKHRKPGKRQGLGYEPTSGKPSPRNDNQARSAETLELADFYEEHDSATPRTPRTPRIVSPEQTALTNEQSPNTVTNDVPQNKINIGDLYKDLRALLLEAVQVLRSMRMVLAEPMAQANEPYAGLLVRRLEKLCLIIYLFLIFVALCMFFCWKYWYD